MVDFKKLLNIKEKSADDLARKRLKQAYNDNIWGVIMFICVMPLLFIFPIFLIAENTFTKTASGLITLFSIATMAFCGKMLDKRHNAMTGILEAFLAGERSISNIAASVGLNNETAAKLIQTMIFKKIIIDANIDRINNRIIDNKKATVSAENVGKIVVCEGCGAKNTLTGKAGQRCEYCGSAISEEMINENK